MLTRLAKWWLRRRGFNVFPADGSYVYANGGIDVRIRPGATVDTACLGNGATLVVEDVSPVTVGTFRIEGTGTIKGPN